MDEATFNFDVKFNNYCICFSLADYVGDSLILK